jgi:hypothetical protein
VKKPNKASITISQALLSSSSLQIDFHRINGLKTINFEKSIGIKFFLNFFYMRINIQFQATLRIVQQYDLLLRKDEKKNGKTCTDEDAADGCGKKRF